MPTESETLIAVNDLIKSGQVQAASDLLAQSAIEAKAAEDEAAGIPPAPTEPREPEAIVAEFMSTVSSALGNPPLLVALMAEFDATVIAPPAPAPASPLTSAKLAAFNATRK